MTVMELDGLRFTTTHEWLALDGEEATVGITAFAVTLLTDLVYVDLPERGRTVAQGEAFGEVESVKAVSDLYAPISGEIVEINSALSDDLAALSEDPYGRGWIIRLRVADSDEAGTLLDPEAYQRHCKSESH